MRRHRHCDQSSIARKLYHTLGSIENYIIGEVTRKSEETCIALRARSLATLDGAPKAAVARSY